MRNFVVLACLFLCLPIHSVLASDQPPFQLIYRQENVAVGRVDTWSDLMITVINLSGGEARDITVSIPVRNPYLPVDSPVSVTTIPDGRQAELLHQSVMANELIALAGPEDQLVWHIEYTGADGERTAVDVQGVKGL